MTSTNKVTKRRRATKAIIQKAKDLRSAGRSYEAISIILDFPKSSVQRWLDPEFAKKEKLHFIIRAKSRRH